MTKVIILDEADNVATAIADIDAGETISFDGGSVVTTEAIPFGHKVALVPLEAGATILKYGESIGLALGAIARGACVHVHNTDSQRGRGDRAGKQ